MVSYALQKNKHLENRDKVMRAMRDGSHRFNQIAESTGMNRRTLSKILDELEKDILLIKTGKGQKIRYSLTDRSHEIFKTEISAFKYISEAYQEWHPSLVLPGSSVRLTVGSLAYSPIVQTGSIYSEEMDENNMAMDPLDERNVPRDPFVVGYEIEGIIHRDVMNRIVAKGMNCYQRRTPGRHGRQHVAVVIDYDALQSAWDLAKKFEDAVSKGESMTLFFSNLLNSEPEDDPILVEMNKTGMTSNSFTVDLSNRHRNALLIVLSFLPAMLEMILLTKEEEARISLHKAIGKSVDGPFIELVEIYLREYHLFFSRLEEMPGDNFQDKAVNYLASMGIEYPKGSNVLELMGILLLISLRNENPNLTIRLVDHWGIPFIFSTGNDENHYPKRDEG